MYNSISSIEASDLVLLDTKKFSGSHALGAEILLIVKILQRFGKDEDCLETMILNGQGELYVGILLCEWDLRS